MSKGLPCPACGHDTARVVESRARVEGERTVYRRRKCTKCMALFSTREGYIRDECELTFPEMISDLLKLAVAMNKKASVTPPPRSKVRVSWPKPKVKRSPIATAPEPAGKQWCEQCEMQVTASEAAGCKSRHCSLKAGGHDA